MAKKESNADKVKFVFYIIVSFIAIVSALLGINSYFAKESEVKTVTTELKKNDQLLSERLDIAIIEDEIDYKQRQIQRIEDWRRIEQKTEQPELTPIEKEVLEKTKTELSELEKERNEKKKAYESSRKG